MEEMSERSHRLFVDFVLTILCAAVIITAFTAGSDLQDLQRRVGQLEQQVKETP